MESTLTRIPAWLRWVLVLPTAIASVFAAELLVNVIHFVGLLIVNLSLARVVVPPETEVFGPFGLEGTMCLVCGATFVWSGQTMAPGKSDAVTRGLATLVFILTGVPIGIAAWWPDVITADLWYLSKAFFLTMVGALAVVYGRKWLNARTEAVAEEQNAPRAGFEIGLLILTLVVILSAFVFRTIPASDKAQAAEGLAPVQVPVEPEPATTPEAESLDPELTVSSDGTCAIDLSGWTIVDEEHAGVPVPPEDPSTTTLLAAINERSGSTEGLAVCRGLMIERVEFTEEAASALEAGFQQVLPQEAEIQVELVSLPVGNSMRVVSDIGPARKIMYVLENDDSHYGVLFESERPNRREFLVETLAMMRTFTFTGKKWPAAVEWQRFSPADSSFVLELPQGSIEESFNDGKHRLFLNVGYAEFRIYWMDLNVLERETGGDPIGYFTSRIKELSDEVISESQVERGGLSGTEFVTRDEGLLFFRRFCVTDGRFYSFWVVSDPESSRETQESIAVRHYNSFRIGRP